MKPMLVGAVALSAATLLAVASGCKTEEPERPELWIAYDADDETLRLRHGDRVLLAFESDGFMLAAVDAIEKGASYDPYYAIDADWIPPLSVEATTNEPDHVVLEISWVGGRETTVDVAEAAPGRFTASWIPTAGGERIAAFRLRPRGDGSEGFYGLGEWFDTPNHRGLVRPMQLEPDSDLDSGYNEAHVPIPFLLGTTGWGLFVEDPHPALFEVATEADDLIQITFGTGEHSPAGLRFHLFGAEHPLELTKHYYDVTGNPRLPARWAYGPWIWRDENMDQAEVEGDANTLRDLDLPASAIWIDRPYATGVNTFDFEATKFPDPQGMIDLLHDLGFRLALWHTPYVSDGAEPAPALNAEATAMGYFPPTASLQLNSWSDPIDFTNPDAVAWWQSLIGNYTAMGIEGFKLDYGEDITVGILGARTVWEFFDGSDERTMHALYQLYYHRTYADMLPTDGGFLLCRGGTYGDQVNVSVVWPGDLDATLTAHREMVTNAGSVYTSVGGLPAAVSAAMGLGPSGFPFFASDTGGYRHSPPNKETFTRWFEHTALSAVMQVGTSSNDVAWEPTPDNGFDAEMLDWYREYTRLHLRLFPYVWSYAERLEEDGRPIVRPLGLAYPELGEHPADVYLLGEHLLVAPVVTAGATERTHPVPPGTWIDWFDGATYEGPATVTVAAPLEKLPLYLQAGGIVPMLRPTIDSLSPTTDAARVDSYATAPGVLYAVTAPGPTSGFMVFDGAMLSQDTAGTTTTLTSTDGAELNSGVVWEVIAWGVTAPTSVTLNGDPLASVIGAAALDAATSGWYQAPERGGTLWVKVPAGTHTVVATR